MFVLMDFEMNICFYRQPVSMYSTVTDLAKFLGLSTSVPFSKAT
jgi:hypothetical protein